MEWIKNSLVSDPIPKYFYHSPLFPNPIVCLRDIVVTGTNELYTRLVPWNGMWTWMSETLNLTLVLAGYVDWCVVLLPAIVGVALTLLRILLNETLFRVIKIHGTV